MQQLIVVRHAEYEHDGRIGDYGRSQMVALADKLQEVLAGRSALIFTSTAPRAEDSATVLGERLGLEIERYDFLWSDDDHHWDLPRTLELVRSAKERVKVLILVTHLEYVEYFPSYLGEKELGGKIPHVRSAKGDAWVLDFDEKVLRKVA